MNISYQENGEETARRHMIDGQLLPNEVTDENVVNAIEKVKREAFVPDERKGVAYIDKSIKVAEGRYLLEPLTFAKLLNAAEIRQDELVLDIAPATGYSSAVFSKLVETVVAIEEDEVLAEIATKNLAEQECDNVALLTAPHARGLKKQGPYDLIFIGGMVDEVPQALLEQLKEDGRLLCVVNDEGIGRAALVTYKNKVKGVRILFDTSAPRLKGFEKTKKFEF
ncbi:MAG: protein-L-isoaspartate O-methyltransferase [Kordiimonadaceae bacterium]|nr:protein-L-isoaspartate O-methyltransferase [Kordiimonadaceae bacterium]